MAVIVHKDAQASLEKMVEPELVKHFLQRLETYPAIRGDHQELDPQGRPIQVKVLKRHAVLYYNDPFANETRVLDVVHVER